MEKLHLNCGSCLYLNNDKIFDKRCGDLGKLPTSKGCGSHKANSFLLIGEGPKVNRLKQVASAITGMSINEIQALAAVLIAERNTRKYGWHFYQQVYIRFTGNGNANYFSNFAVGHVVYADKDTVRIVGDSGKMLISAINDRAGSTIYTIERFKLLAAEMTKKRHFNDPQSTLSSSPSSVHKLDDILDSETPLSRKLVKSKTQADDLVAIVSKMSMGLGLKTSTTGTRTDNRRTADRRTAKNSEITMDF